MTSAPVRPSISLLTEDDVRPLLAPALIRLCADHGPAKVGLMIGCSDKTVSRARDKRATLEASTMLNLLAADEHALDAALLHFHRRSAAADATCSDDALPPLSASVHRLAVAQSERSPGGKVVTVPELAEMEADLLCARAAIDGMLARLNRARAA